MYLFFQLKNNRSDSKKSIDSLRVHMQSSLSLTGEDAFPRNDEEKLETTKTVEGKDGKKDEKDLRTQIDLNHIFIFKSKYVYLR